MAIRGRKPKPTHLKLIEGNPGERPLNENEPKPEGDVLKPRFLKGRAAAIWDEYAPELIRLNVLTSVDAHMFATWCALAAELERSPRNMTAARIAQMRALASSFGMDASSRSRLEVPAVGKSGRPGKDEKPSYFDD